MYQHLWAKNNMRYNYTLRPQSNNFPLGKRINFGDMHPDFLIVKPPILRRFHNPRIEYKPRHKIYLEHLNKFKCFWQYSSYKCRRLMTREVLNLQSHARWFSRELQFYPTQVTNWIYNSFRVTHRKWRHNTAERTSYPLNQSKWLLWSTSRENLTHS